MRANPQDSKNGGFYLPRSRECRSTLPSAKNHCLDSFTCSPRPVQGLPVTGKTA
ncbi:hypothetical protein SynTAK9802_01328 [Synechococcus sp. TAK9802]|nr:hypothetical protein SynTAK9802_01328 [Synechococcus sp. TAK9802]